MNRTTLVASVALASSLVAGAAVPAASAPAAAPLAAPAAKAPTAQATAKRIAANKGIVLLDFHVSGKRDPRSTARANIKDTAAGKRAHTSTFAHPRGARVALNGKMLQAMLKLNTSKKFTFRVTSIAGGRHSAGSAHYKGRAFDVDLVNGSRVSTKGPGLVKARKLMSSGKAYGAKVVLGPGSDRAHGNHVHCQW